ncbi:MAG TPA: amidohydrolase family protein [Chloroflexota bacterium]|nr:amidohydrolase family protein [Chloroflexota bacterium]
MPHRIDCHVHYHASAFADMLLSHQGTTGRDVPIRGFVASRPAWHDLDALREVMDQTEVELGVIIPIAGTLLALSRSGAGATEAYNRSLSDDLERAGQGRFLGAAVVDPFGGKDEVAQLDRSLKLPHIGAIGLVASYEGVALDDPAFEPLWEVAREHNVPVMVHPSLVARRWVDTLRLDHNVLEAGLGFLLDDALCILRLILNGTLDKFPDVRFMFCQLGGFATSCCARWDFHRKQRQLMSSTAGRPVPEWANHALEEYLGRIWLDTHSQDRNILRLALAVAGEHAVVLGGDYPLTLPEDGVLYNMAEIGALGLSPQTTAKIERDNALTLLGR